MKRKLFLLTIAGCLALTLILLSNFNVEKKIEASPTDLIVHEWGTFTSIAGKNGAALDWRPLNGASDLPDFVYTENETDGFRGTYESRVSGKTRTLARVRMETPVIYFYTKKEMDVEVSVGFPKGKITEWYPQASIVNEQAGNNQRSRFLGNGINWGTIKLLPDESPNFLREAADSHYYPARETDAVPVRVCNYDKTKIETEKFLFYRGIGNFDLPLNVKLIMPKTKKSDHLSLSYNGQDELRNLIVFENSGGRIGFKFVEKLAGERILVERPETDKKLEDVFTELERLLVAEGLYAKEARAMIETWKDSWFEEGLRVFYILPGKTTDEILPLKINPQPRETIRVLVGRAEIITLDMEREVKRQVGFLKSSSAKQREAARAALQKHGRFYEPILKSVLQNESDAAVREQLQKLIETN